MKLVTKICLLFLLALTMSRCATICGGSRYNAHILVNGRPGATIYKDGNIAGSGSTTLQLKRNMANRLSLTVKEKGCKDQTFEYRTRAFRGWALVGTLFTFTTSTYVPYGLGIDLATGALWKPNEAEPGVSKHNYKNYQYTLNYTGCESKSVEQTSTDTDVTDKLVDVVYLKNGSIIRGTLMESNPSVNVKIQTRDGSIFVFKIEEVLKVTRE